MSKSISYIQKYKRGIDEIDSVKEERLVIDVCKAWLQVKIELRKERELHRKKIKARDRQEREESKTGKLAVVFNFLS